MKRNNRMGVYALVFSLCLLLLLPAVSHAQEQTVNQLAFKGGYGFETPDGSNGYSGSIGYGRTVGKAILSLTAQCLALGHLSQTLRNARQQGAAPGSYRSLYITPAIGWCIMNEEYPVMLQVHTGLGFRLYNYALPGAQDKTMQPAFPRNGSNCAFYAGMQASVFITGTLRLGAFADTYSNNKPADAVLAGLLVSVGW
ncbi:hypothetical protein [Deminuibacter soli]|uniref:Outer membrane protein beta-barrel domain-containing protein n=1 Tax=Deminuibacter soli TaxID=2291815 RepID=A0A3E1NF21_9BACT|nr:hypothetical protein [Deminuibacter soli]RFM26585.1 hypothetical protein DXN05_18590 [Deminuibacter soli]